MGARFQFKEEELRKSLKVFGWSMGSALVALALSLTGAVEIPGEYAFVVPLVNVVLYAVSEFIKDNTV